MDQLHTQDSLLCLMRTQANEMRRLSIEAVYRNHARGHFGGAFSMCEILSVLFNGVMRKSPDQPLSEDQDRFFLSKGHGVLSYYAILALRGYFTPEYFIQHFEEKDSIFAGHPTFHPEFGLECATGSLGHGLPIAVGAALGMKCDNSPYDVYALVGDGECNEGTIWESAMIARQYALDNLIVVVDYNHMQVDGFSRDVIDMEDMAEKWRSFGWSVSRVDGHDVRALYQALHPRSRPRNRPYCVIADTIKGKGISFMEDTISWHRNSLSDVLYQQAIAELDACGATGGW